MNVTSSSQLKWILSVAKGYKWRMFWFFFMEVSSIAMSLLFVLYSLDSAIALVILAIIPLFLFVKIFFRRMRTLNAKVKQRESEIGSATQENLRYRIMLRALGIMETRLNLYIQNQLNYFSLKLKYLKFTLFSQGIMRSSLTFGYLIAFGWGVYQL